MKSIERESIIVLPIASGAAENTKSKKEARIFVVLNASTSEIKPVKIKSIDAT